MPAGGKGGAFLLRHALKDPQHLHKVRPILPLADLRTPGGQRGTKGSSTALLSDSSYSPPPPKWVGSASLALSSAVGVSLPL
jgi:hypothetical protein